MIQEHDVTVVVPITISGPRHCGNSCRFMRDAKHEIRGRGNIILYEAEPTRCLLGPDPAVRHGDVAWGLSGAKGNE